MLGLAAVIALILLHAFFVAGEFALVAADRARIDQLSEKGHKRALSVQQSLKKLSFELSGAQLGITVTSLLVGFLAEPLLAPVLEPLLEKIGFIPEASVAGTSLVIALLLATTFEMIVAELIPRNVAIAKPIEVAFVVAAPMRLYNRFFKPLILFLNGSANQTLRLFGIEPKEELTSARSLEELDLLIRSSRAEGALEEENAVLLARSISFGNKTAADVLGIAHVKDSYAIPVEKRPRARVDDIVQEALVVPESRPLASLLPDMRRQRRHLAVVIDEFGGTAGIVTIEDLIEEIVGEIEDEYDRAATPQTRPPQGSFVLSGLSHPDEVEEASGLVLPEGEFETLAGFLLSLFDRIPEQGDHITYEGWEIKVVAMDRNRIDRVLLVSPPSPDDAEDSDESNGR